MLSDSHKKEIGARIRDFRVMNKYTQAQFAESINISINFLSEIENGKKGLSYETIINICEIHSVSSDYLLFGKGESNGRKGNIIEIANGLTMEELETTIEYLIALQKLKKIY